MLKLTLVLLAATLVQESPASLLETTDWIRTTLSSHGNCIEKMGQRTRNERIDNLSFDGCSLSGSYVSESSINSTLLVSVVQQATLQLSDIESIAVDTKEHHWLIVLKTTSKSIKGDVRIGLPGQFNREPLAASKFVLPCDDKQIAERISKALDHAVALCKKQKEPF